MRYSWDDSEFKRYYIGLLDDRLIEYLTTGDGVKIRAIEEKMARAVANVALAAMGISPDFKPKTDLGAANLQRLLKEINGSHLQNEDSKQDKDQP